MVTAFARDLREQTDRSYGSAERTLQMGSFTLASAERMERKAGENFRLILEAAAEYERAGKFFVDALEGMHLMDLANKKKGLDRVVDSYRGAAKLFEKVEKYGDTASCYEKLQLLMEELNKPEEANLYAAMRCVALKKDGQDYLAMQIMREMGIGQNVRSMLGGNTKFGRRDVFAPSFRCA